MIHTEVLRPLDLDAPSAAGRRAHLSAASGLVRAGDQLWTIADDEVFLARFAAGAGDPGHLIRIAPGELPEEPEARKAAKPDFEGVALLPPSTTFPTGALLVIGSGSTERRTGGVLVPLRGDGTAKAGEARPLDLAPLYSALRGEIPELNIEGVAVVADALLLLQRGDGASRDNAIVTLALEPVVRAVAAGEPIGPDEVAIHRLDIGELGGVALSFTDISPLPDGRLVFSAAAEDTIDPYLDGPVAGSVLGIVGADGSLVSSAPLDATVKIEGVDARLSGRGIEVLAVADADDPAIAAPLLAATIDD